MKHSKLGRLLSLLLALALMLGVLPTAAHAEEAPYTTITDIGSPHLFANGTGWITPCWQTGRRVSL